MSFIKLFKSALVPSNGNELVDTYTPADGEVIDPYSFHGSAPGSSKARCKLIWDYGGGGEEILWVIQNDRPMPRDLKIEDVAGIRERTGDGVKVLAISLHNNCTASYDMAAYAIIEIKEHS